MSKDRRSIDWRLGWVDRERENLRAAVAALDRQEKDILSELNRFTFYVVFSRSVDNICNIEAFIDEAEAIDYMKEELKEPGMTATIRDYEWLERKK